MPSGSRATAAMNSMVTPAVTTPSATPYFSAVRENCEGRGRTNTRISTPAQNSRSQAAPSAPMRSISPTEAASPSCTHSIETTAMPAPVRAWFFMPTQSNQPSPFAST